MVSSKQIKQVILALLLLATPLCSLMAAKGVTSFEPSSSPRTHFGPTLLKQHFVMDEDRLVPIERASEGEEQVILSWYWQLDESKSGDLMTLNGGHLFNAGAQVRLRQEEWQGKATVAVYVTQHSKADVFYARLGRQAHEPVYRFPLIRDWNYIAIGCITHEKGKYLAIWTQEKQKVPAYRALISPLRKDTADSTYVHSVLLKDSIMAMSEIRLLTEYRMPLPKITHLYEYK